MVSPEMTSDRNSLKLYSEAQSNMGKKYWRPRTSFRKEVWFLKRWRGSSGKKISETLLPNFCSVVLSGGRQTLCISIVGGSPSDDVVEMLITVSVVSEKLSTLFEPTPISWIRWVFVVVVFCVDGLRRKKCALHGLKFIERRRNEETKRKKKKEVGG